MASYSLSSTRKRGKFLALAFTVAGVFGISFIAFLVGALTGMDPGLSVRFAAIMAVPMLLVLAWAAPKGRDDPSARLNQVLFYLMLVAIFWPPYAIFSMHGLPSLDPKRLVLLFLLVFWLFKIMTSPVLSQRLRTRLRAGGLPLALFSLFLVWRLASAVSSEVPVYSFIQFGWEFLNYYLVFFVALSCLRDTADIRKLVILLATAAFIISLIAILERLVGHNLFAKLVPMNADFAAAQAAALEEKLREGGIRAQATFEHPMVLAEFLVFTLPMIAFVALKANGRLLRFASLGGILLVLGGIVMSGTRSAILTGGIVMFLSMILYFFNNMQGRELSLKAFFSVLGMIALVCVLLASTSVMLQLIQGRSAAEVGSSSARLLQMQAAVPKIRAQPLLGYGVSVGNQELGYRASHGRFTVDNYYLTLTMDSGLPAGLLFALLLLVFCALGASLYFRLGNDDDRMLAGMLTISVTGFMVTKSVLSIDKNLIFLSLGFAFLLVLKEKLDAADGK